MPEVLRFFKNNEVFIYLVVGILAVWQIRQFIVAWNELRSAAFGLEQESARTRLSWATSMLVLILILGVAEFGLVAFIIPSVPEASPLLTPTLDILATPTITLETTLGTVAPSAAEGNATPIPTIQAEESGCVPGRVEILSPTEGETIRDVVEIQGTADIPNFGFYKFEMAAAGETSWLTIQAGEESVSEDILGYWDTTRLIPGDYALRLIVTDNQGNASDPCTVQVRVEAPIGE